MFALDTNTLIYFFKRLGRVKEHLAAVPPANVAVPSVVLYGLEIGIAQSLVTHNAREFRRVRGLDLADWY